MTVTPADVYTFIKTPGGGSDPAQEAMMQRFIDAAEEWFAEFYSAPDPVDPDADPPEARPTSIDLAIIMKAARMSKRQSSPEGVLAVADFGPIRVTRTDPDIDALIAAYRVYRVGGAGGPPTAYELALEAAEDA